MKAPLKAPVAPAPSAITPRTASASAPRKLPDICALTSRPPTVPVRSPPSTAPAICAPDTVIWPLTGALAASRKLSIPPVTVPVAKSAFSAMSPDIVGACSSASMSVPRPNTAAPV